MKLTIGASGPATPEVVWDRYIHPARWSEWSSQIRSVDYSGGDHAGGDHAGVDHAGVDHAGVDHAGVDHAGGDHARGDHAGVDRAGVGDSNAEIAAGGRGTVHGPCGIGVAFEITAVDDERRCWTWQVKVAGITMELGHEVLAQGSGTRTTLDITGPAPIVIGYAPIARLALSSLVREK